MEWTVIGAGPSGIAAIGKLLEAHVPPSKIAWIDPHFLVGDLGEKWSFVSSNTKVKLFIDFLESLKSFEFAKVRHEFPLTQMDPESTCFLSYIAKPLQWVTDHLVKKVQTHQRTPLKLHF